MRRSALPFHYGWVIAGVTFFVLLAAAGVRTIPSVITPPLEAEFGWTRTTISTASMISLFAFGFGGPIAGTLVERLGLRRVMFIGIGLTALGTGLMMTMMQLWQLNLLWGIVVGIGTGTIANVLGAAVANRWFNAHRGIVMGALGAAGAAGQFIFLQVMFNLAAGIGWRLAVGLVAVLIAMMLIPVILFIRNHPSDIGGEPVGGAAAATGLRETGTPFWEAIRTRDFWLLALSFFICGYTTNGLIQHHLLLHAVEHGFVEVEAIGAVSLMGLMNIFGTLASGWLSDRYDNRKLLMFYYGFRGLSLAALPFLIDMRGLLIFSVVYGLDWIATVPPTVNLTAQRFGRASLGTLYGWIFCSHMIGAGIAAQAGGFFRDLLGDYHLIFISAAVLGLVAAGLSLGVSIDGRRRPTPRMQPQPGGAD